MSFKLLALFSATVLATLNDGTNLVTPVVETVTTYETVTGSPVTTAVNKTVTSYIDLIESYLVSELEALEPTYPSWVESVLDTAIPSTWAERMSSDQSFSKSVADVAASGILPAWYSSLPSDVKYVMTSDQALYKSEISALTWPPETFVTGSRSFLPSTPVLSSSISSSSSSTESSTSDPSNETQASETSPVSTGGAPVPTGNLVVSIVGAAGVLGLALAL
ncbi:hypothetical protein CBS115989_4337 [Aspergillus niger]|nr:uncharacterized protein BO96DRAFT_414711 [Aspergillus niger CBS 101883]EHA25875.1 hypothetical protein ASPNIDRAFT_43712 [Aspergillus niger ATCC 1015]KAI2819486.1 hypothetical protein CBS115989_4337 [Aspergillus niger]RDH20735.1 hypothetical protein M747DRAFT_370100 [Aspergillus niger ATCC 13496]KAI2829342.1 hypothetical protein CBS133816_4618 [Aspergillus niger]KAI2834947.1 hypothetical protein CBS11350_10382 [Aspergillus niger]